ncbi:MAG: ABC-type branched-chain amino acid transport system, ATPase component [Frankiales bacterium]|nr:ABC-type branched-chain amino acid transport system, ATPase component [Frankiales bacterium]
MRRIAGAPALPLAVLFALNLVDELDRVAFGVLSPEIRTDFGLTDAGIVGIGAAAGVTSLLAALPLGVLADRVHRVRLAAGGAFTWAGATVLTALSPTVLVLALARTLAGTGRIVNEPVHASLLSDYYPPAAHPRVFALHRVANPLGLASAVLVGVLGAVLDWRTVFVALAVPTLLVLPLLLRLPEPVRGSSGVTVPGVTPVAVAAPVLGVGAARRRLASTRTLRRVWVALPVLGVAVITLPQLVSLYFERVHGYGPTGRGVVTALSGVGITLGLAVGQRAGTRSLAQGRADRLGTVVGLSVVAVGLGLGAMVLAPSAATAAGCYLVAGIGVGAYQPAFFTLTCLVAPPALRGQAFAYSILLLGVGGLLSPLLAVLGSRAGYPAALGLLAGTLVVGGLALLRTAATVQADALLAAPVPPAPVPPAAVPSVP